MKRRIWKISEDRFDDVKPELNISPSVVEMDGNEEQSITGSFTITSTNNTDLKGFVYSSSPYVICDNPTFEGKNVVISYHTNTKAFTHTDSLEGYFDIVYNMGEVSVPFKFTFNLSPLVSSIGEIKTLEDFGKLCEINFHEGLALFRTRAFERFINKESNDIRVLYKGYSKAVPSGINLQHFLEEVKLNTKLTYSLDQEKIEFTDILDDQRGSINITRSSWGKLDIFISTDAPFIDLPLRRITDSEFLGREYDYHFYIRTDKMHQGKNRGEIKLYDGCTYKSVFIEANLLDEDLPIRKLSLRKKKIRCEIFRDLISYRTGNLGISSFCKKLCDNLIISFKIDESESNINDTAIYFDENGKIHERKEDKWNLDFDRKTNTDEEEYISYRLPVFDRLLLAHARILNSERQKALWLIRDLKVDIKDHFGFEWAYLLYLCILIDPDEHYQEKLTDEIEKIFRMNSEDLRIFVFLLYLRREYLDDPARKLKDIKQWVNSGYVSPLLLEEALDVFKLHPYLLQSFDGFVISVLNFAQKNKSLNSDIITLMPELLRSETEFNPLIFKIISHAYECDKSIDLLEAILSYLIKNECFTKKYSKWYRKGIEEGINVSGLYEAYINSLPLDSVEDLPESVLLYFRYPSSLTRERKAYLYVSVISAQNKHPRIYREYLPDIESFALAEMQQERIDDNLSIIYQEMMDHNHNFAAFSELVVPFLFIQRIAVMREEATQIILYQDCYRKAVVAPLVNHIAYVPITDKNYRIFLVDMDGTVHSDRELYVIDPIIHLDTENGRLPEKYSYSVPAMLYNLTREDSDYSFTEKDIPFIESIFNNSEFDSEFLLRKYPEMYELLKKALKEDVILSYIWTRRNKLSLPKDIVSEVVSYAIRTEKYEEVYDYIKMVDASGCNHDLLLALVNYMIVYYEFASVDTLIVLASELLMKGYASQNSISYLQKYYAGSTECMQRIFRLGFESDVKVPGFSERLVLQMLYTGYNQEFPESLFKVFLSEYKNRMVKEAFLTFWAREYILKDASVPECFMNELYRSVVLDDNVNDSMRIALMKYLCDAPELSREEITVLDKYLRYYISRNIRFSFFKNAPKGLVIKYHLNDRSFISLSYKPSSRLYIKLKKNNEEDYVLPMPEVYSGLYNRSFALFTGEVINYSILEGKKDGKVIKSGVLSGPDYFEKDEEGRFERLNHMKYSIILGNNEELKSAVSSYGTLDIMTKNLFSGL